MIYLCSFRGLFLQGVIEIKITRRINTNAAIAVDKSGNEIVVFGKGIGFPQTPYELHDLSKIERTFYDIAPQYHAMIAELPQNVVLASAEIADQAEITLQCELNPNLPFTLADHLNFAVTRMQNGMNIPTPLAYDVKHLYPKETSLGLKALDILEKYTSIRLPDSEVYAVAMHIINAEAETGTINDMMFSLGIIHEMETIVENHIGFALEKESYSYSRFVMHLQFLIQRLSNGKQTDEYDDKNMLFELAREYPDDYVCANEVAKHLRKQYHWNCNNEEILYLMMHIHRVRCKNQD